MLQIDFADANTNADPFPLFARLREQDPVHWSEPMKAWIVTRYDDVKAIALDNSAISADRLTPVFAAANDRRRGTFTNLLTYLGNWMVFRDPPDHARLRRLFTREFTTRSVESLAPGIESLVAMLLDDLSAKERSGETVDWIADFAYPLPATVIMDLLGVPRHDLRRVKAWSDEIAPFIGISRASADKYARAEAGARAMADFFRDLMAERRVEPRDDLISQLVASHGERDALSDDEVIATCILLLFAGHETTTNMLGNGLYHSMRFRDQWERLTGDLALVGTAIEEWLRYDGPSGALARIAAADVDFGGRCLKKGQRVLAFTSAANRDGMQFPNPETFDIGRVPNPHLTFGHGIHFCLGAPLARLEGQIAVKRLAERFPDIRLADDTAPTWTDSVILRGLAALPVKLT
ncbi:cytochrome P450 [Bradyrhizobium sp.]|uniref:cytochrome P450 n=1 Tax=Bradyrhizobium sp. TaxID=376 RepID=UPI002735FA7F|nr:cytochrome P450 [Bradyrhizobium sp.]MDP3078279.1 cytochrome P450 [Bradyrhizobium sp.]